MTKDEMMALLRDPDQTGQAVDDLNRLIEKNPYFHTGHQLYLKGLQQTDEAKMALQLRKTALNVRDRSVLYNYLNSPSASRKETSIEDKQHDELTVPFVPGSSYISQQDDIHHTGSIPSETSLSEVDPLTMGAEWKDDDHQIISEEKIMSDEQLLEMVRQRLEQIDSSQTEEKNLPASGPETGIKLFSEELTGGDLVDSFLKANPKIIPGDSQYQVDLSAGMQENNDIATETLADIYESQGHKDKAIEIYQQLILKNPEKDIYFARQIDRLIKE